MGKKNKEIILVAKEPKRKRKEYGIVYPDGSIEWNTLSVNEETSKYKIIEAQKQAKTAYLIRCKDMGLLPSRTLIFVERTVTTSYSKPVLR